MVRNGYQWLPCLCQVAGFIRHEEDVPLFYWLKNWCGLAGNSYFHYKVLLANCKMQWAWVLPTSAYQCAAMALSVSLMVHILPTKVKKRLNIKQFADFTRVLHCSNCEQMRNVWNCRMIFTVPQKRWTLLRKYVQPRVSKRSVKPKNCWNFIFETYNTIQMRQMRSPLKIPSLKIKKYSWLKISLIGHAWYQIWNNFLNILAKLSMNNWVGNYKQRQKWKNIQ